MEINAKGIYYKDLIDQVCQVVAQGYREIKLVGVNGQRYLGTGLNGKTSLTIEGTPGNDMAAYLDGSVLEVFGNAQDGVANTMNDGTVIIHGHAGDALGYAMRGGKIFVRDSVGYRVGIHMKEYLDKVPVVVIGGTAGDFLGEYMAGGILILLGLNLRPGTPLVRNYCGTGMHGGAIYLRGQVETYQLGKEVKVVPLEEQDYPLLKQYIKEYAEHFGVDAEEILKEPFQKLIPFNKRPYGNLYTGW